MVRPLAAGRHGGGYHLKREKALKEQLETERREHEAERAAWHQARDVLLARIAELEDGKPAKTFYLGVKELFRGSNKNWTKETIPIYNNTDESFYVKHRHQWNGTKEKRVFPHPTDSTSYSLSQRCLQLASEDRKIEIYAYSWRTPDTILTFTLPMIDFKELVEVSRVAERRFKVVVNNTKSYSGIMYIPSSGIKIDGCCTLPKGGKYTVFPGVKTLYLTTARSSLKELLVFTRTTQEGFNFTVTTPPI